MCNASTPRAAPSSNVLPPTDYPAGQHRNCLIQEQVFSFCKRVLSSFMKRRNLPRRVVKTWYHICETELKVDWRTWFHILQRIHAANRTLLDRPPAYRLPRRSTPFLLLLDCRSGSIRTLPTETNVESGISQSKSGTSVHLSNSGEQSAQSRIVHACDFPAG